MSMEMDTCRKSGIEEISNYAVRLQDKGDKEARENIDKLMIFYVHANPRRLPNMHQLSLES